MKRSAKLQPSKRIRAMIAQPDTEHQGQQDDELYDMPQEHKQLRQKWASINIHEWMVQICSQHAISGNEEGRVTERTKGNAEKEKKNRTRQDHKHAEDKQD